MNITRKTVNAIEPLLAEDSPVINNNEEIPQAVQQLFLFSIWNSAFSDTLLIKKDIEQFSLGLAQFLSWKVHKNGLQESMQDIFSLCM